jgi:hypothetical protein
MLFVLGVKCNGLLTVTIAPSIPAVNPGRILRVMSRMWELFAIFAKIEARPIRISDKPRNKLFAQRIHPFILKRMISFFFLLDLLQDFNGSVDGSSESNSSSTSSSASDSAPTADATFAFFASISTSMGNDRFGSLETCVLKPEKKLVSGCC